jgi:hypothetical protein
MQMKIIIVALVLGLLVSMAVSADIVTITLTPDPRIEQRIKSIDGPERETVVVIARNGSSRTKGLRAKVHGAISDEDVQALVQSILARDDRFWNDRGSLEVLVLGDADYAAVEVSMYCGDLCGSGETYTYGRTKGRWNYLYRSNQWVS